jgi:hypothetical protein
MQRKLQESDEKTLSQIVKVTTDTAVFFQACGKQYNTEKNKVKAALWYAIVCYLSRVFFIFYL